MLPDTPLDPPLFNDALHISTVRPTHVLDERRHSAPGRRSYRAEMRRRSAPQLASSTDCTRESWFTNFSATYTIGDIASLSSEYDIFANVHTVQSTAALYDAPPTGFLSKDDVQIPPCATPGNSYDVFGHIAANGCKSEDSLYSMDSADQDAHPLLLSIPIIPRIKLEREATIRKSDSSRLSNGLHNQALLFPCIPITTISPRRYGHNAPVVVSDVRRGERRGMSTFRTLRRFGSTSWNDHFENSKAEQMHQRSVSEPTLHCSHTPDDEGKFISKEGMSNLPLEDLLFSAPDEADAPGLQNRGLEQDIDDAPRLRQVDPKHVKRSHKRSSVTQSISFSTIVRTAADGCVPLDLFRKSNPKYKSVTEPKSIPSLYEPTSKWAPREGQIFIKVFVPSTDDIWMFCVPHDVKLVDFTTRVVAKLGFIVSFSGSVWNEPEYYFRTDEQFKTWVKGRIRFGRNLPIVAHALAPLPLVRLSVDAEGCEVWCYA